jgi:hypothetical protein
MYAEMVGKFVWFPCYKQTNPSFFTNVTTSDDIAHAYFGWFLNGINERFYIKSFRNLKTFNIF